MFGRHSAAGEARPSASRPDAGEDARLIEKVTRRDLRAFGELVDESQAAAESLLGNQVPETVWLARQARALGACAASAFGAGFGGSVWALVSREEAAGFTGRWREAYEHSTFKAARTSEFLVTAAGPPAIRL